MNKTEWLQCLGISKDLELPSMEENKKRYTGCKKCNYETFLRDHDGSWLKDCDCIDITQ